MRDQAVSRSGVREFDLHDIVGCGDVEPVIRYFRGDDIDKVSYRIEMRCRRRSVVLRRWLGEDEHNRNLPISRAIPAHSPFRTQRNLRSGQLASGALPLAMAA
jgi:hypothetical protein